MPSALPVLQTTCPILPGGSPDREPNFAAYMDEIRAVAAEGNLPLVDHTRHWEAAIAQNVGLQHYWMSDAFHPNEFGHRAFAELIFKELDIFDPTAPTCRLFRP